MDYKINIRAPKFSRFFGRLARGNAMTVDLAEKAFQNSFNLAYATASDANAQINKVQFL